LYWEASINGVISGENWQLSASDLVWSQNESKSDWTFPFFSCNLRFLYVGCFMIASAIWVWSK
jgi:hypothetical protein